MANTRPYRTRAGSVLALVLVAAITAACGSDDSSDASANAARTTASTAAGGCAPVAGTALVILSDNEKLQPVGNVVAAINAKAANPALVGAVDRVAAALDTRKLVALNRAIDVDRKAAQTVAAEFASASGLTAGLARGPGGAIKIGVGTSGESQVLGALYKIVLDAAGYDASVAPATTRERYEVALERGGIQVVPEYLGVFAEFLNQKINGPESRRLTDADANAAAKVLTGLGQKVGLVFGAASAASDQTAFAVTKETAARYGVTTLSQFGAKCSGGATVLGGPAGCDQDPFCQVGLRRTYGLSVGRYAQIDPAGGAQTRSALKGAMITLGIVASTDGEIASG